MDIKALQPLNLTSHSLTWFQAQSCCEGTLQVANLQVIGAKMTHRALWSSSAVCFRANTPPPGFDSQSGVMMKPWLDAGQAKPSTNTWPAGRFQWQWQVGLWSRNLETELENKTQRIISHYNVLQRHCLHFKCKTWKDKFSHSCVCTPQDLEGGKLLIWQGKI